ncbi:MAG: TetR/AcrR family transcriptional regulator [Candidatus Neoclostridium sp.]
MKTTIRQPRQSRAIEKKNKIIEAGYKIFSENGYFGSTTPQIAKLAGVSTGIVYGYFKDKRDILLCVLDVYIKEAAAPVMEIMQSLSAPLNLGDLVKEILDKTIEIHKTHAKLHEALHSLAASDKDVRDRFLSLENHITLSVSELLPSLGVVTERCKEKVHLAINLVQSFAHEYVFDNHPYLDYSAMYDVVIADIVNMFN